MTGQEEERLARVALNRLAEPGDLRLAALVAELGAVPGHRYLASERGAAGLATDVATRLAGIDPRADLDRAKRRGLRFVIPGDDEWPPSLEDLDRVEPLHLRGGAPLGLWVRGPLSLDALTRSVAVVGSRSATSYGTDLAGDIGAGLARAGWAVVSGAAFGIDQAAHRGALGGEGVTVAVVACGADRVYPAAHR
ncbi:MAG: DNA-processing protein DprA, partial [Nocardioides sp.]